jgi:glycerate 2-kinase
MAHDLQSLRRAALEIFSDALKEIDAGRALRERVSLDGSRLTVFDTTYNLEASATPVYAVAIGKAAVSMAAALDEILGSRLTEGIVAAPSQTDARLASLLQQLVSVGQLSEEEAQTEMFRGVVQRAVEQGEQKAFTTSQPLSSRWRVFAGGHPLPNQKSLQAARAAIELLRRADKEGALVLFLISGGGSAAFELPNDARITLEDLRRANQALVSCGATIAEINAVRRAVSAVKGGRLSAFAARARQVALIVSDTNPGQEWAVASGPTLAPPAYAPAARDVIERYRLNESLPSSIVRAVNKAETADLKSSGKPEVEHHLLLDNQSAIEAARRAAHARGFRVEVAADLIEQPVEAGCAELLYRLHAGKPLNKDGVFCLISGGEFACPVHGKGIGGRNAETTLRMALALDEAQRQTPENINRSHAVFLSAGTDGIDGNSPAAGAVADEKTLERARSRALDARRALEESDAYTFFHALDDAILTGRTGTNVRDLRVMLAT